MQPKHPYRDPRVLITDLLGWVDTIRDLWPDLETRLIRRERRKRLKHARGKISDAELAIELEAIQSKRRANGIG